MTGGLRLLKTQAERTQKISRRLGFVSHLFENGEFICCHINRMSIQSGVVFSFKLLFSTTLYRTGSITSSEQPAIVDRFNLGETE